MTGHVQSNLASQNRETREALCAKARAAAAVNPEPSTLPLNADEAELCERLRGLMAKPPKRVPLVAAVVPDVSVKPVATPAETVAERPPLPPLPELPVAEVMTGAPGPRAIRWVEKSRRRQLSAAVRSAPSWIVTFFIIAGTLAATLVMVAGVGRSADLIQRVPAILAGALMAIRSTAGL